MADVNKRSGLFVFNVYPIISCISSSSNGILSGFSSIVPPLSVKSGAAPNSSSPIVISIPVNSAYSAYVNPP
ncbi:hypothetical protein ACFVR2_22910 [Gottfriedia sp. NPDC057991]|uniref:hypothetical protein n=1 Tax=Gottfriedia sp. NPDC057991 TaxID=3346298 RepID=UPI0036DD8B52